MKKSIFALLVAGICSMPSIASAATPYVSASVGVGFISSHEEDIPFTTIVNETSYEIGTAFNGALGVKISNFRLEAALGYQTNSADHSTNDIVRAKILSYMANAYYDIPIENASVTPYIMLGLGGASITLKNADGETNDDNSLNLQAGAGIGIKASETITVDLGYRYAEATDLILSDFTCHQLLVGARYAF
jgi:opacity protein-like surface antigen